MSLFALDTDLLTLYYHGDPIVVRRVDARPHSELAISVMTVDEQLTGWYTLTRQARRPEEIARAYAHLGEAVVRLGALAHPPLHGIGHRAGRATQGPPAQHSSHGPAHRRHRPGASGSGRHPQPA
jgi:hypothetical protein